MQARWTILVTVALVAVAFTLFCLSRPAKPSPLEAPPIGLQSGAAVKDVYERRAKSYLDGVAALKTNFKLQAALIVLAIVMIRTRLTSVSVKGVGLEIPALMVQWFIPMAALYLWLGFGFELHNVLENRMMLWHLIGRAESGQIPADSQYSARQLLRDQFFTDEYFLAFHPCLSGIKEGNLWFLNRAVLVGFGLFLGALHGVIFATLCNLYEESPNYPKPFGRVVAYSVGLVVFIALSHIQFRFGGPHSNWLQPVILCSAAPWALLFASWRSRARPSVSRSH